MFIHYVGRTKKTIFWTSR